MKHRIFKLTETAVQNTMDWDTAIAENEIETVEDFATYEEAVEAFDRDNYDTDLYGVE